MDIRLPDGTIITNVPEGTTKAQLSVKLGLATPQEMPKPSMGESAARGFVQGGTLGFGDEAMGAIGGAMAKYSPDNPVTRTLGIAGRPDLFKDTGYADMYRAGRDEARAQESAAQEANPWTYGLSQVAGGAATLPVGKMAQPFSNATGARRIGNAMALGAQGGALAGLGTSEADITKGDIGGAAMDTALGAGIGAGSGLVLQGGAELKKAILPSVDKTVADLADKAVNKYGIPLKQTQLSDSRFAKGLASTAEKIPLTGATGFNNKTSKAFNRAVLKTIGEDADSVSPEVIARAYQDIGQKFDDALAGQKVSITDDIMSKLAELEKSATDDLTGDHARIVTNKIGKLLADISDDGTIKGEKLGSLRSALSKTIKMTKGDAQPYIAQLRDLVVDMGVEGSPARRELLNLARSQYRNLKTIEPLAAKAARGDISPSLLLNRVATNFSDFARGGGGDLGELARIGQAFLKDPIPNSGTPERLMAYGTILGLGGGAAVNPVLAAQAAGGIGTAAAYNALNRSQPLVKSAIKNAGKDPKVLADLIKALQGANPVGALARTR